MSESKHTPEPWEVDSQPNGVRIIRSEYELTPVATMRW